MPLQRIVTDFAADAPYAKAVNKVQEHYGIELGASSIRKTLISHAQYVHENAPLEAVCSPSKRANIVIAEMDGGMVPIVEVDEQQQDKRKGKQLLWKEVKLCLAHPEGANDPVFGGTFSGGVDRAGKHLYHCAIEAGFGAGSQLHSVGDGATWIANQIDEHFGAKGSYLIDLYHLCEYLSQAAPNDESNQKKWLEQQKSLLKQGAFNQVLASLKSRVEPSDVADKEAPVRRCFRYMSNRPEQFFYKDAIEKGLPIGSGEIESAHRYVVQHRFKLPGAWWKAENVDYMLALQLNRANGKWDKYWEQHNSMAA